MKSEDTKRREPAPHQPIFMPSALERTISEYAVRGVFRGLDSAGLLDIPTPGRDHPVEVTRDIAYGPEDAPHHRLDVYQPDVSGPTPTVIYIHGGGFRLLSKDTHWMMAKTMARWGYTVFNINYRLAPEHPYPGPIEDASLAYQWVLDNAHRWGADPEQIILAGESAGGNLVTALSVATSVQRPETWARDVFATGVQPTAAVPTCAILQVSDPLRIERRKSLTKFVRDRLLETAGAYLPNPDLEPVSTPIMADPIRLLEQIESTDRPLPPMFAAVGTRDPLLDDTRRLAAAADRLGGRVEARYYPGEIHAFHAFAWREHARTYWLELAEFLDETIADKRSDQTLRAA